LAKDERIFYKLFLIDIIFLGVLMFSLFLDESGIESFKDPQQYYVVAGVIFDREYCRSNVMPQVIN